MHIPEDYAGAPDPLNITSAGSEAKRAAEMLCALKADARLEPTVARCFSFVGPYLPLDDKFAAGNFIRDALKGGPIRSPATVAPGARIYAADLAIWLWTILLRGRAGRAYNVGSEEAITIGDLARLVGSLTGADVRIAGAAVAGRPAGRYVPDTARARGELDLAVTVDLRESLLRTIGSHRKSGQEL